MMMMMMMMMMTVKIRTCVDFKHKTNMANKSHKTFLFGKKTTKKPQQINEKRHRDIVKKYINSQQPSILNILKTVSFGAGFKFKGNNCLQIVSIFSPF